MSLSIIASPRVMELSKAKDLDEFRAMVRKYVDTTQFETFGTNLTVATYIRSEKTAGGIYKPAENIKEDEFQGNIGLVVKVGAGVKREEQGWRGKWVRFGYADGLKWRYNDVPLRDISVDRIRGTVQDPTKVL